MSSLLRVQPPLDIRKTLTATQRIHLRIEAHPVDGHRAIRERVLQPFEPWRYVAARQDWYQPIGEWIARLGVAIG